ncbi:uncharacterized protein VNE69_04071 [Vairimorpha necatrix]|uniref:Uncharacterized protein n=1 Tax=Vairimorpha necatrix TaxID=6039 RepID=A0AAX4JB99_9MICR
MILRIILFTYIISATQENMLFSYINNDICTIWIGLNVHLLVSASIYYKLIVYSSDSDIVQDDKPTIDPSFRIYNFINSNYDPELLIYLEKTFFKDNPYKMKLIKSKMLLKTKIDIKAYEKCFLAAVFSKDAVNIRRFWSTDVCDLKNNNICCIQFHLNNSNFDELLKIAPENSDLFVVKVLNEIKSSLKD